MGDVDPARYEMVPFDGLEQEKECPDEQHTVACLPEKEKDEVYSYFENMMYLANAVYRSLPSDWGEIGGALRESATDNAVYTWESNAVYDIYNDKWSPINTIDDKWSTYYAVIHDANAFLNDYTEESLERLEWDGNYEDNLAKLRIASGAAEQRLLLTER